MKKTFLTTSLILIIFGFSYPLFAQTEETASCPPGTISSQASGGTIICIPIPNQETASCPPGTISSQASDGTIICIPIPNQEAEAGIYKLLAPIPCVSGEGGNCKTVATTTTLQKYLPGAFKLSIGLTATFVVISIVIGGLQYMTSTAFTGKAEGLDRIKNSLWALVCVLGAWAILYNINPALTKLDLEIETIQFQTVDGGNLVTLGGSDAAGTGTTSPGYTLTGVEIKRDEEIRKLLKDKNVTVNAGPCVNGRTSGCTNVVGLPQAAIVGVQELAKRCDCALVISGGTEGGHKSHGKDKPILDLRFNDKLDRYITNPQNWIGERGKVGEFDTYTVRITPQMNATFVKEVGVPGGDHWHVMFGR